MDRDIILKMEMNMEGPQSSLWNTGKRLIDLGKVAKITGLPIITAEQNWSKIDKLINQK
jgi:hypothetical protein